MSQKDQTYKGQTLTTPVYINGNQETNPQITIARTPYLLERYYFDKIIKGESLWLNLAQTLLGAAVGLFINWIAKFIGSKIDDTISVDNWEVYAFFCALGLMLISYLINHIVPNQKRNIVKEINEHFENT